MPRSAKSDLPALVTKAVRALKRGKQGYKDYDKLMAELEKQLEPGQIIATARNGKQQFVDTWAGKTKVNVGMNARRFEFKEATPP